MVQGVDGALVGFATFIPDLINDLWEAVQGRRPQARDADPGASSRR